MVVKRCKCVEMKKQKQLGLDNNNSIEQYIQNLPSAQTSQVLCLCLAITSIAIICFCMNMHVCVFDCFIYIVFAYIGIHAISGIEAV